MTLVAVCDPEMSNLPDLRSAVPDVRLSVQERAIVTTLLVAARQSGTFSITERDFMNEFCTRQPRSSKLARRQRRREKFSVLHFVRNPNVARSALDALLREGRLKCINMREGEPVLVPTRDALAPTY